jgi:hypothetical protein
MSTESETTARALVRRANDLLAQQREIEAEMERYCAEPKFRRAIYMDDAGHAERIQRLWRVDTDWLSAYADALTALGKEAGLLP